MTFLYILTKKGKQTSFQHSDLSFSDPRGKPLIDLWNMECKSGYSKSWKNKKSKQKSSTRWDVLDILDSRQGTPMILDFWKQTKKEARKTNRIPILFFRRNNRSACVCFTETLFESLTGYYKYYYLKNFVGIFIKIKLLKDKRLIIINLKDFMNYITLGFNSYIEKCLEGSWKRGEESSKPALKGTSCTKIRPCESNNEGNS